MATKEKAFRNKTIFFQKEQLGCLQGEQCIQHPLYSKVGEGIPTDVQEYNRQRIGQTKIFNFGGKTVIEDI
jgi:hypothetical protein